MQDIPEEHHLARFCSFQKLITDETGNVTGLSPWAFELRPKMKETYLSCDWVEFYSGSNEEKLSSVRKIIKKKRKGGKKARIAIINVSSIKFCGKDHGVNIKAHQKKVDSSYSGIYGLPLDNSNLALLEAITKKPIIDLVRFI